MTEQTPIKKKRPRTTRTFKPQKVNVVQEILSYTDLICLEYKKKHNLL